MAASLLTAIDCNYLRPYRKADGFDMVNFALKSKQKVSLAQLYWKRPRTAFASSPSRRFVVSAVAGAESSTLNEDTKNLLDTVQVFGLDGKGVPISDLWKDRKAVVAFARHFGLGSYCQYAEWDLDRMDASGVSLILVGPGSVEQARTFHEQTKFKGEVYADPSHASYEALQFAYGVFSTFTPKAGLKIIQSYMEGYRQDWSLSSEKDTVAKGGWQQGGILVAGPGKNNISYIHRVLIFKFHDCKICATFPVS
ncbi:hypothetical protein QQ045_026489 [Rhodiola kirilowii]